jgi:hypothetical protein
MKTLTTSGKFAAVAVLALAIGARADTVVQNFTETFPLTASPTGDLPQIDLTWSVNQYSGFGGLTSLTSVQYSVTTELYYRGVLVAIGDNKSFNLQVRSAFTFDLPGSAPDINTAPLVSLSGTTGTSGQLLDVPGTYPTPASDTQNADQLATDLATYVGNGVVPVVVSGSLLDSALGGYHNNSDLGDASPFVFVDNAKVFPVFGYQEFSLVATLTVTYAVPETGTYAAAGFIALLLGGQWAARRRKR